MSALRSRVSGVSRLRSGSGRILALCAVLCMPWTSRSEDSVPWTYEGDWGQEHWGSLSPRFAACGKGHKQSPIDIVDAAETELPPLRFPYHWQPRKVLHTGYAIEAQLESGSWMVANDHYFELQQIRFRTPSENRIEGKTFPLEAQYMHRNSGGEWAVVSVFFEEGEANPSIGKILAMAPWSEGEQDASKLRLKERVPRRGRLGLRESINSS